MQTRIYTPSEPVESRAIDFIWHTHAEQQQINSITLPYLKHEIIFNFGDYFSVNQHHVKDAVFLSGMRSDPISTNVSGTYHTLGLMLAPATFYRRFGIPVVDMSITENLTDVLGKDFAYLCEQIGDEKLPDHKISLAKTYFSPRHFKKEIPAPILNFIDNTHTEFIQKGNLKAAAKNAGISAKHLINTFKSIYGCTPHRYLQLLHFNKSIQTLVRDQDSNACVNGFYDQSHFAKIFRQFSGLTVKEYRMALSDNLVAPNFANTILQRG
jgi:AraC-like DNA-binding protein